MYDIPYTKNAPAKVVATTPNPNTILIHDGCISQYFPPYLNSSGTLNSIERMTTTNAIDASIKEIIHSALYVHFSQSELHSIFIPPYLITSSNDSITFFLFSANLMAHSTMS